MSSTPSNSKTVVTAIKKRFSGRAQAIIDQGATSEEFVLGADEMLHHKPKGTPAGGLTGYTRDRIDAAGTAFREFVVLIIWPCAYITIVMIIAVCLCSLYDKVMGDIPPVNVNGKETISFGKGERPARQYL
jgi:hypothetical protein